MGGVYLEGGEEDYEGIGLTSRLIDMGVSCVDAI